MIKKIICMLALTSFAAKAVVTVSGAAVVGLTDEDGVLLGENDNVLVLVVADSGGDDFSRLIGGDLVSGFSFVGLDGNDVVIKIDGSNPSGGLGAFADGSLTTIRTSDDDASVAANLGDEYIVYWFPGLSDTTTTLTAGDVYGSFRYDSDDVTADNNIEDWVLPSASGDDTNSTSLIGDVFANATFSTVIPEPSSTALLGLGGLALLARRRRA